MEVAGHEYGQLKNLHRLSDAARHFQIIAEVLKGLDPILAAVVEQPGEVGAGAVVRLAGAAQGSINLVELDVVAIPAVPAGVPVLVAAAVGLVTGFVLNRGTT